MRIKNLSLIILCGTKLIEYMAQKDACLKLNDLFGVPWRGLSVEHVTLDLRFVSLSPMFVAEIT